MLGFGSFPVDHSVPVGDSEPQIDIDQPVYKKRFRPLLNHDAFFRELLYLVYLHRVDPGLVPKVFPTQTEVNVTDATLAMAQFDGSLHDIVAQDVWVDRRTKVHLFRDLCRLVHRLHRAGVVHGDLRLTNVLRRSQPNTAGNDHEEQGWDLVLSGFGKSLLARDQHLCHDPTGQGQLTGYHAPELYRVARAKRESTLWTAQELLQTDLYSLGICGLELFGNFVVYDDVLRAKHADESVQNVLKRLGYFDHFALTDKSNGQPNFQHWLQRSHWERTDPTIRAVVLALLHPDPTQRPSLDDVVAGFDDKRDDPTTTGPDVLHPTPQDPTPVDQVAVTAIDELLVRIFANPVDQQRYAKVVDHQRLLQLVPSSPVILFMDLCRLLLSVILVQPAGALLPDKVMTLLESWPVRPSFGILLDRLLDLVHNETQTTAMITTLL